MGDCHGLAMHRLKNEEDLGCRRRKGKQDVLQLEAGEVKLREDGSG